MAVPFTVICSIELDRITGFPFAAGWHGAALYSALATAAL